VDSDLDTALRLADTADAIATARFGSADLVVDTKPDMTPVSDADRAVEQALRDELERVCPHDAVLGEEYGGELRPGRVWIIDPIDATRNFVRRVPVWATLIALVVDGIPVVGVATAPALYRRWWAATGLGSWTRAGDGPPTRNSVSRVDAYADASFSYSDPQGWDPQVLAGLTTGGWRSRAYGDFWSHVMVAEGIVDAAAEPELSIWDVAALVPIVTEAGGRMSGFDGSAVLTAGSAVTSNGMLHEELLGRIAGR
jgi:histidinol-phosphatase